MPDYSKGLIYTIRNREDDTKIYVGSTIQPLYKRFHQHKIDSKKEKMYKLIKLYQEVNNDWSNWYIELYENYPCSCREELHKKEGEVIRLIGTLNKYIAGRDHKEWYIDNIEKVKERGDKYRIENADIIKERKKQYSIKNAEMLREKAKNYRINNIDVKKQSDKKYYEKNKDEINKKITCECGCIINKCSLLRHQKTTKHINLKLCL
jgi:hypothetical protein